MIELILIGAVLKTPIDTNQIVIDKITTSQVEKPAELTLQQKIDQNVNNCNTDLEWIWASDATCHPKVLVQTVSQPEPIKKSARSSSVSTPGNTYTAGYCTWFVKNMRPDLPNNLGHANTWFSNAVRNGLAVGTTPQVGAVAVASNYTHVAIVQAVHGSTVTISEMNYVRWNVQSTREAPISEFRYIY